MAYSSRFALIIFSVLLLCGFWAGLAADDAGLYTLAADQRVENYRTGSVDRRIDDIPDQVHWLVDFDPPEGMKEVVRFLTGDSSDGYLQVKRIHDWIVETMYFDADAYYSGVSTEPTISAILKEKRADSRGIARLFNAMCTEAGIESRIIAGRTNRYFFADGRPGNHFWNILVLDGTSYIVDCTADLINEFINGEYISRRGYSDTELFIRPDAKILKHLPNDDRNQLLDPPVLMSEFLDYPAVEPAAVQYGLRLTGGREQVSTQLVPAGGSEPLPETSSASDQLYRRVEVLTAAEPYIIFRLTGPADFNFFPVLRDNSGTLYERHAFVSITEGEAVIRFTRPEVAGEFHGEIYLAADQKKGRRGRKELLYRFQIPSEMNAAISRGFDGSRQEMQIDAELPVNPLLPEKAGIHLREGFHRYGMVLLQSNAGPDAFGGYTTFALQAPEQLQLQPVLETEAGVPVPGAVFTSSQGPGKHRYYLSAPEPGRYFFHLTAVDPDLPRFPVPVLDVSFFEQDPMPAHQPPHGAILFREVFYTSSFVLIDTNFDSAAEEGVYRLSLRAPPEARMDTGMYVKQSGADQEPAGSADMNASLYSLPAEHAAVYERHGDVYNFYFAPPPGSPALAVVRDKSERILEVLLEPVANADFQYRTGAYQPGWLYRKNGLEDFGITILDENIHGDGNPGYAFLELAQPPNVSLAAAYESLDGRDLRKGNVVYSSVSVERKKYFFKLPEAGQVKVTVLAGTSTPGQPVSRVPALEFILLPDPARSVPIPPPGELVFFPSFHRHGLVLHGDTYLSVDTPPERSLPMYSIEISAPESVSLQCRLFWPGGLEIHDAVTYSVRNGRYRFLFSPFFPDRDEFGVQGPVEGRITAALPGGKVETVCRFTLP